MSSADMLDKQLSRLSQECLRLGVDRWRLALTNGSALVVNARREDGFLLLDAEAGANPTGAQLVPLVETLDRLPATAKFALPGLRSLRVRAEFPLPEERGSPADRIECHLEGMRCSIHRLRELSSREPAGEQSACPKASSPGPAAPGSLPEAIREAGWEFHERDGGGLVADLEVSGRLLQAHIERTDAGARFRVTLFSEDSLEDDVRQALYLYLLQANAALRYVRAFVQRQGEATSAGFEVRVEGEPSPAEAGHALAALSVSGRFCAREMELFKDSAAAGIYRSARGL